MWSKKGPTQSKCKLLQDHDSYSHECNWALDGKTLVYWQSMHDFARFSMSLSNFGHQISALARDFILLAPRWLSWSSPKAKCLYQVVVQQLWIPTLHSLPEWQYGCNFSTSQLYSWPSLQNNITNLRQNRISVI